MPVFNNGSGPAVKRIIGTKLQRGLGLISRSFRAVLAAEYVAGGIFLTHGSPRQAAFLFDVPMSDVRAIRRATPLEVEAVKHKRLTIEGLRRQQLANHRMSDAEFKRTLIREGVGRALDLIDELTRPASKTNGHAAANDNGNGGVAMPAQLSL